MVSVYQCFSLRKLKTAGIYDLVGDQNYMSYTEAALDINLVMLMLELINSFHILFHSLDFMSTFVASFAI